jgi:hypothetical protein
LQFSYDAGIVAELKESLRLARYQLCLSTTAGGWLPERRVWFVEHSAWPTVSRRLQELGCTFTGLEPVREPDAAGIGPLNLPVVSSAPAPASAPANQADKEVAERAREMLAEVAQRALALQTTNFADNAQATAWYSCAIAANANLSEENLSTLAAAIREGRLPRKER